MKLTLFTLLPFTFVLGYKLPLNAITGGATTGGSYSWIVFLKIAKPSGTFDCAGTLISSNFILTAGHCAYQAQSISASGGRYDLTKSTIQEGGVDYNVLTTFIHSSYDPLNSSVNDIALLAVQVKSNNSKTATKPAYISSSIDTSVTQYTTYGWGAVSANQTSSNLLMTVPQTVISKEACQAVYTTQINDNQICAGSTGSTTCKGDSGGPLISFDNQGNPVVQGITSWGTDVCGTSPSGFTKVSSYANWITETMKNAKPSQLQSSASLMQFLSSSIGCMWVIWVVWVV